MKQNQCKDVTFKDVVRMFDLLKRQGYKVEDIMQMKIDYDTRIYNFRNKIEICEDEDILWFDTDLDDECFSILYDLIKDGLIVKEKKDE